MDQYDKTKFRKHKIEIGDIFKTNHWGDVKVVCNKVTKAIIIKFLNTGNVKSVRAYELRKGGVEDTAAKQAGAQRQNYVCPKMQAAFMVAGEIYPSNYWGDMEVVEYKSSKDITIRFVESGNTYNVQRYAVLTGMVKDVERSKNTTQAKYEAEKARKKELKERAEAIVEQLKKEAEEFEQFRKSESEKRAAGMDRWYKILREHRCHFCTDGTLMSGKEVVDRNGFVYQIIIKKAFNRLSWVICYKESGNIYWVDEETAKTGNTYDKLSEDSQKAEKLRLKLFNAAQYEADRERRIAMASAYQKANLERTRVRNRNRRALRMGAEGSHTLEEVTDLLNYQNNKCKCCDVELTEDTRELDHIMPLILGGTNYISNLQWLCQFCNGSKNATHPDEWAIYSATDDFKKRRQERLSNAAAS